jgi:sec-independent protein translocase protein TatA
METIGLPELLVIGVVFMLLFGTKKIPELGKGLGEGIRNFKAAIKGPSAETPAHADGAVMEEPTVGKA